MNHHAFDAQMRRKAQQETLTASADSQRRFQQAMQKGATQMNQRSSHPWKLRAAAYAASVMMIAAAIWIIQPPSDRFNRSAVTSEHSVWATTVPVTVPECKVSLSVSNRTLHAEAQLANHTGEIWLIQWNADPGENAHRMQDPTQLIWLETGITLTDQAGWRLSSGWEEQLAQAEWHFKGYRVSAQILHWIEGEWLLPGAEGYAEQQMLIEDAFENGALILAPGDWPEGTSGEMQLVLPDSYQKEHPETDALSYYVQAGLVVLEAQEHGVATVQE